MAKMERKSFDSPEETRSIQKGQIEVVKLGDVTVMRTRFEPGWRWSECIKPVVNTDSCQNSHVGFCVSGKLTVETTDGGRIDIAAGDSYTIPPGHDAWVEGGDPFVGVEFLSAAAYAKLPD